MNGRLTLNPCDVVGLHPVALPAIHEHAVMATDAHGAVVAWSGNAQHIHGYPADQVVGRMNVTELFGPALDGGHDRRAVADLLSGLAASPAVWVGQLACRHASGVWFTADVVVTPRSCDASSPGVLLVCRPIPVAGFAARPGPPTAPHGELFAKLGHELRSPLTGIIGLTGILQRGVATGRVDPTQQLRQLDMIRTSAGRLLVTIEQVVDIARIDAGQISCDRRLIDGRDVVRDVTAALRQGAQDHGLRLHAEVPDSPVMVVTDPTLLAQVLRELLDNAVKFAGTGDIRTRITGGGGQPVMIDVRDDGPGIPDEEQSRIFKAFERGELAVANDDDGAGLGLYLACKLADLLHADLALHSRPGWGSTFAVTFLDGSSPASTGHATQSRS